MLKILLVEDSETDVALLIRFLKKENIDFNHSRVWDKDAFIIALKENRYDLIIADQVLPSSVAWKPFALQKMKINNSLVSFVS